MENIDLKLVPVDNARFQPRVHRGEARVLDVVLERKYRL